MHRFVTAVSLSVLASACAVIDMPDPEAGQPAWVEDRIAAGDRRDAPAVVPVTSLAPGEEEALDRSAQELIRKREALEAEAERVTEAEERSQPSDFIAEGQDRTTPPEQ